MLHTPEEEILRRVAAVQEAMRARGMDFALVVQNADLYYLSGTIQQSHLVLPAEGEPTLLVRRDVERAREESPLLRIEEMGSMRDLTSRAKELGLSGSVEVGVELDVLPVALFRRYESLFPEASFSDCSGIIRSARAVKSSFEVNIMRRAASVAERTILGLQDVFKEGMSEVEVAGHLEGMARRYGTSGMIRFRGFNQEMVPAHVMAGPEAALPSYLDTPLGGRGMTPGVPQGPGERVIGRDEPIIVDFVSPVDGYLVDQTRVFFMGRLPDKMIKAYEACTEVQSIISAGMRPGVPAGEVYEAAVEYMESRGYGDNFMGYRGKQVYFVGHGVGLELDELPVIARGVDRPLETGNVIACEPKVVFPGEGVVGIENTWLVTEDGAQRLTVSDERLVQL